MLFCSKHVLRWRGVRVADRGLINMLLCSVNDPLSALGSPAALPGGAAFSASACCREAEAQPLSPPMRMGLKLRMDTPYGQDKAVLTKLLQEHGVAVRGGIGGAMQLLDILMEWKRMPPPPADTNFMLNPNEEGHDTTAEEYMAELEQHWRVRKHEWLKRPEYKHLQHEGVV